MTAHSPAMRIMLGLTTVVVADLATKFIASSIAAGRTSGLLVPVRNHELSLGISDASAGTTILLAGLGIVIAAAVSSGPAFRGELPAWIPACLLGGALANLIDRIAFGSVRDFLATPWVIVNLADIAVLSGIVGWLVALRPPSRAARMREHIDSSNHHLQTRHVLRRRPVL